MESEKSFNSRREENTHDSSNTSSLIDAETYSNNDESERRSNSGSTEDGYYEEEYPDLCGYIYDCCGALDLSSPNTSPNSTERVTNILNPPDSSPFLQKNLSLNVPTPQKSPTRVEQKKPQTLLEEFGHLIEPACTRVQVREMRSYIQLELQGLSKIRKLPEESDIEFQASAPLCKQRKIQLTKKIHPKKSKKSTRETRKEKRLARAFRIYCKAVLIYLKDGNDLDLPKIFNKTTVLHIVHHGATPNKQATTEVIKNIMKLKKIPSYVYDMMSLFIRCEILQTTTECHLFLQKFGGLSNRTGREIQIMINSRYGAPRHLKPKHIYTYGITACEFKILMRGLMNLEKQAPYLCFNPGAFHEYTKNSILGIHHLQTSAILEIRKKYLESQKKIEHIIIPVLYVEDESFTHTYIIRVNLKDQTIDSYDFEPRTEQCHAVARVFSLHFTDFSGTRPNTLNKLPNKIFRVGESQEYPKIPRHKAKSPCSLIALFILYKLFYEGKVERPLIEDEEKNLFARLLSNILKNKV